MIVRTPVDGPVPEVRNPAGFVSLSVGLDRLEQQARSVVSAVAKPGMKIGVEFLPRIVESLYRRHFGGQIPPRVMRGNKAGRALRAAAEIIKAEGVDPTMWVMAQFNAQMLVKSEPNPFAILNLLHGDDARRRYNGFIAAANRKLHHASSRSFEGDAAYWKLVDELERGEDDVATDFVFACAAGETSTWNDSVSKVAPSKLWLDIRVRRSPATLAELRGKFGKKADLAVEIAKLRVATNLANQFRYGLDHQIGFVAPFDWNAFAELIAEYFPRRQPEPVRMAAWQPTLDLFDTHLTDEEIDA